MKDYEGDIKVVYKHFVVHPQTATASAQASCSAGKQGKFKEMHDLIFEKAYDEKGRPVRAELTAQRMEEHAQSLGLDVDKYKADIRACTAEIKKDETELRRVGISGTPGFFINGRYVRGAQPLATFKRLVEEELKKANARISKQEATASNYYQKFVLEKGKKSL